jgi:aspartate/methionine/tyrosine aminotransferase
VAPPHESYFICAGIGAFADATQAGADVAFCRRLVAEGGVAAIPPSAFYADPALGAGYVRFAFCKREDTLRAAVARLAAALPAFA